MNNFIANLEWKFSNQLIDYSEALQFMENWVDKIINHQANSLIWVLEHYPVYTAGISAKDEDLLFYPKNVPIFKVNRGGKYSFHGPGMKIIYLMLDLKKLFYPKSPDISLLVACLENFIIKILQNFNIEGQIKKGRVGVWCNVNNQEQKIAAIGIKVRRWVCYHGIAINFKYHLLVSNHNL